MFNKTFISNGRSVGNRVRFRWHRLGFVKKSCNRGQLASALEPRQALPNAPAVRLVHPVEGRKSSSTRRVRFSTDQPRPRRPAFKGNHALAASLHARLNGLRPFLVQGFQACGQNRFIPGGANGNLSINHHDKASPRTSTPSRNSGSHTRNRIAQLAKAIQQFGAALHRLAPGAEMNQPRLSMVSRKRVAIRSTARKVVHNTKARPPAASSTGQAASNTRHR